MEHSGALFDIDDAENRVVIIPPVIDGDTSKQATEEDHTHPGGPVPPFTAVLWSAS
jgi:hypothetical protein